MKKILLLLISFAIALSADDLTGREVIMKMESSEKVLTTKMEIKLTHTDIKNGKEKVRVRELVRYHKRYKNGNYKSKELLRFSKPDIIKGTGFLIWSSSLGSNEQWLYLPKLKTAKQIESKEKTKSFMNTEFSYEDLESFNKSDEQYFLKGKEIFANRNCYIVEVIGHTQTQYKRRLAWVDDKNWLLHKVEFYDKNNKLLKILTVNDYKNFEKYHFAQKMNMKNIQTGSQTVMDFANIKYNIDLPESYFTKESLVNP